LVGITHKKIEDERRRMVLKKGSEIHIVLILYVIPRRQNQLTAISLFPHVQRRFILSSDLVFDKNFESPVG